MSWFLSAAAMTLPILSLLAACAHGADDYTAFVYAGCSQARYNTGTQYAADVDSVLSALTDSAGSTTYATYKPPSGASTGLVGLYQCRADLPAAVCGVCVKTSVSKLSSLCNSAAGGAVQLRACFLRYGNDSFLGKQDTAVLFKKCGGDNGVDAGVAALRDGALGALQAASSPAGEGSYRAGAAGYVQAMSQCVGDLGDKACTDCVSAAAAQLKAGCGDASAGEVYLGKCYARFWSNAGTGGAANGGGRGIIGGGNGGTVGDGGNGVIGGGTVGVPDAGNGNGYGYGLVPRTYGDVQDGSGKTLAIIIGIVAAAAVVIVFLSFLKRARAANGKS